MALGAGSGCSEEASEGAPAGGSASVTASGGPGSSGEASAGTSGGGTADATSASTSTGDPSTSAGSEASTTGDDPCAGIDFDAPCSTEGQQCQYEVGCGWGIRTCIDGGWEVTDGFGCGSNPVPCAMGPVAGDECDETTCDPDGDCLSVLECELGVWAARDVCNAMTCPEADPQQGTSCEVGGWVCTVDHACGERTFRCAAGHWRVQSATPCAQPQACSDHPLPGDACDEDEAECTYDDPGLDPVTCDGSTWG